RRQVLPEAPERSSPVHCASPPSPTVTHGVRAARGAVDSGRPVDNVLTRASEGRRGSATSFGWSPAQRPVPYTSRGDPAPGSTSHAPPPRCAGPTVAL